MQFYSGLGISRRLRRARLAAVSLLSVLFAAHHGMTPSLNKRRASQTRGTPHALATWHFSGPPASRTGRESSAESDGSVTASADRAGSIGFEPFYSFNHISRLTANSNPLSGCALRSRWIATRPPRRSRTPWSGWPRPARPCRRAPACSSTAAGPRADRSVSLNHGR